MAPGRACDRCHRYKGKCSFDKQAETCTLCNLSGSTCTTSRLRARQGRRPKPVCLGLHDSVNIWELGNTERLSISKDNNEIDETRVEERSTPASEIRQRTNTASSTFLRTTRPARISMIDASNNSLSYSRQPSRINGIQFPGSELTTIKELSLSWIIEIWYARNNLFMLGPTFARGLYSVIQRSYECSPLLLHDSLIVLTPMILLARQNAGLVDQVDINKGTKSLQMLRTANVTKIQDAIAIVALGQILAAFDLLTYSIGPNSILQYSISAIRPWYRELSKYSALDTVTITPIFWDTIQCLVTREVPALKFVSRDPHIVDRMAGLCTTLLPIFYDLCVENQKLKTELLYDDASLLCQIEQRFRSWRPEPPADIATNFTKEEILRMKAQASMYRAAGLLICHRILSPLGTRDAVALSLANSIIQDFSRYSALLGPGIRLQNITFPTLFASFEIPGVQMELWRSTPVLAAARSGVAIAEYVWMKRGGGYTGSLFELFDTGPEFIVIP